jgi:hypothetical protein
VSNEVASIGMLSDSHGRAAVTQRAVEMLVERGVDVLIHLGDVGGAQVLDALVGKLSDEGLAVPPVHIVFGNTDYDSASLSRYATAIGIQVDDPVGRLELDGKTVAFSHGHLADAVADAMATEPDYFLHGHTHKVRDERIGSTRVINPGALHRATQYTVAVLDTEADRLEIMQVPPTAEA